MKKEKATPKRVKKEVVVKKPSTKKKVVITGKENKPEMISYEMKMVIPTGQYANIQPCIIVKGGSVEEAHDFIAPHMNKLWKEYFMISERPAPVAPAPKVIPVAPKAEKPVEKATEAPKLPADEGNKVNVPNVPPVSPASAVSLNKATQAITSCMSKEALDLLSAQVEKSVKLGDEEKVSLRKLVAEKVKDFDGK